jgi:hypothetical protein
MKRKSLRLTDNRRRGLGSGLGGEDEGQAVSTYWSRIVPLLCDLASNVQRYADTLLARLGLTVL